MKDLELKWLFNKAESIQDWVAYTNKLIKYNKEIHKAKKNSRRMFWKEVIETPHAQLHSDTAGKFKIPAKTYGFKNYYI